MAFIVKSLGFGLLPLWESASSCWLMLKTHSMIATGTNTHPNSALPATFLFPTCWKCTDFFFLADTHTHTQKTHNQTSALSPSHSGHRHRRCLRPHARRYAIYFCEELSHYFAPRLMKLRPTCTKLRRNTSHFVFWVWISHAALPRRSREAAYLSRSALLPERKG